MPFYAGWGLTTDLGPICPRRAARPTLEQLAWATLIAYPRYVDPISGLPCTPELIVERLSNGQAFPKATALSRLQSLFASQSWLWR
jgi:capsular polysaccharide export protein